MAATLVGTPVVAEAGTGYDVTVGVPTGTAAGDLLIVALGQKGSTTIATPSGWLATPVHQANSGTAGEAIFYRWATASEPASHTFTAAVSGGVTGEMSAWRGVDPATPFDIDVVGQSAGSSTTITVASVTTVTANALVVFWVIGQTTGSAITSPAELTEIADTTGTGRRIVQAYMVQATPGATGTHVFSSTSNFTKAAITAVLRPAASSGGGTVTPPAATAPTLTSAVVGISDSTVGHVKVRTANATAARLRATPVGGGTAILGSSVTPSAVGASDLAVSGLTPGAWYTWEVGATDSAGAETFLAGGRLRAAPVGATSFSFDFGSCTDAADSASLAAIAARSSDLFLHLGDLYYADGSGTDVANMRAKFLAKVTAANHKAVLTTRPSLLTESDHGGMNNNSTAGDDPTAWTNWNQVFREFFPTDKIPATTGAYFTFVWGRVRFIVWDDRSFKSDKDNADNASKTALGATQKAWTKSVVTDATEPVIIIAQSSPWIDTATASEDGWGGYITERNELGDFFAASGKNIVMLGGDMHAVAADDGTSANARGVDMMLQAAPFYNSASQKGGPYKVGPYPTGSGTVQQYGHVDITDDGTNITVAFQGLSSDNTQRVALSKTFSSAPEPESTYPDVPGQTAPGEFVFSTYGGVDVVRYLVRTEAGVSGNAGLAYLYLPSDWNTRASFKLLLAAHGMGDDPAAFIEVGNDQKPGYITATALESGYAVISPFYDATLGNADAQARMLRARNFVGASVKPVAGTILMGFSMGGGAVAVALHRRTIPDMRGALLVAPALDLAWAAAQDSSTAYAAYGATDAASYAAATADFDPMRQPAWKYGGVRALVSSSSEDDYADMRPNALRFLALVQPVAPEVYDYQGSGGHTSGNQWPDNTAIVEEFDTWVAEGDIPAPVPPQTSSYIWWDGTIETPVDLLGWWDGSSTTTVELIEN